jgi:hypothetical protein
MRTSWAAVLVVLAACAGSSTQGVRTEGASPAALEELRRQCPDYYARTTPEQHANLLNRVIVSGYTECVVVHMLGEPRARRPVADLPGTEQWYYDRDPGYLEVTLEDGVVRSWTRCESCGRWYAK